MNTARFALYIFLGCLLFVGCSYNDGEDIEKMTIKFDEDNLPVFSPSVRSSVRFLPLETTDKAIVGDVDKILFSNNLIYIADYRRNSVFVYSPDCV